MDGDSSSRFTPHVKEITHGQKQMNLHTQDESNRSAASIPDDVLVDIFDFYRKNCSHSHFVWKWQILAHVCQRWRQVVFASSQRLKLQILCTYGTPVRKNLSIWPAFPIVLDFRRVTSIRPYDEDNAIAALEHSDRVCSVLLNAATGSQLRKMATVMQKPFPVLTLLNMLSWDFYGHVLPAEFLGGSAPCLQEISLIGVPFPALGTLLLSATDLVKLDIRNIPPIGYIPPEAMVAALPRLETLIIGFQSATSRPNRIRLPPATRTVLPALTEFRFQGSSEYLEDFVAQIDSPQLDRIHIVYLDHPDDSQVAQLSKFIDRSVGPELTPSTRAHVSLSNDHVAFTLYRHANYPGGDRRSVGTTISYDAVDWQISHMAQVLRQFSAVFSTIVHLKLGVLLSGENDGLGDIEWLPLFHQFPAVQMLYASWDLAGHVALALEKDVTAEMVAEVLPSLALICLEGQPASSVEKFVASRRLSGRPVIVVDTKREFDEKLESYVGK